MSYSELSENCTIAESTNNMEPIVYKYNNARERVMEEGHAREWVTEES